MTACFEQFRLFRLLFLCSLLAAVLNFTKSSATSISANGSVLAKSATSDLLYKNRTKLYILWMFGLDGSPHGWGRVPLGRLAVQDINQHPNNLLKDYELVALERPTTRARADLDVKTTLGIFVQAVYNPPQIIMSTCPPYTPEATAIAQLAPNYNLITMAGLSTSPTLSDKKAYPLFLRTSMSTGDFKYAALTILRKFGWHQVIGLYMDDPFAIDTAAELERYLESNEIWFETKTIFKLDATDTPVAKLVQKSSSRVIVAIVNGDQARYAVCQLFRELGAAGAEYVWMFIGITVAHFERPRPYDAQKCTQHDMNRAINGSFWFDYGGLAVAEDRPMLTLYRPSELRQRLKAYIDANYSNTTDKTVLELAYWEYDAFLAIAAALNSSIDVLKSRLNVTLEQFNYSRADMTAIFKQQFLTMNVPGAAGTIRFQANGDRPASFTLRQFQATPRGFIGPNDGSNNVTGWVAVAVQRGGNDSASTPLEFIRPVVFGTIDQQPPLGMKYVGFFGKILNVVLLIIGLVLVCVVLPTIALFAYWTRRQALAAALNDPKWILNASDFTLIEAQAKSLTSLFGHSIANITSAARARANSMGSTNSVEASERNGRQTDAPPMSNFEDVSDGYYYVLRYQASTVVCLFPLVKYNSNAASSVGNGVNEKEASVTSPISNLRANRQFILEAELVNNMQEDNLTRFIGILFFDPSKIGGSAVSKALADAQMDFAVYEWQNKGPLRDVLMGVETLELDLPFKFSMWNDISSGLAFIHRSPLQCHGRLRSDNIFVDNRFCCKISDFGYSTTKKSRFLLQAPKCFLLWTAPELLAPILENEEHTALASLTSTPLMQKADIFSLAVITYEIITRQSPYENTVTDHGYMSDEEILNAIVVSSKKHENFLLKSLEVEERQSTKTDVKLPEEARRLIEQACDLSAHHRPTGQEVVDTLHRIGKQQGMSSNIMENLLRRVEQYAKNLEALVHEKTQAFFEEKKRAETLLYTILPRSVADQLKDGKSVEPESYDSASIYFSDVVGFTSLSAESTPIQVVDLLNDLYNMFDAIIADYDVYKVETIGDAYMVASGLPQRNGIEHARQIARMAQQLVRDMAQQFRVRHKPEHRLNLRVGLHSGPCAAGVVGFVMPRYCLFGDTVNTASRMESTGEAMRIHVSTSMYELLQAFEGGEFACELRGETVVKGKGVMRTYWLLLPWPIAEPANESKTGHSSNKQ